MERIFLLTMRGQVYNPGCFVRRFPLQAATESICRPFLLPAKAHKGSIDSDLRLSDGVSPHLGGDHMATSFDNFWGSANEGSSVPPVDPADLRSVWTMQSEIQARNPGQQIGISAKT
jgi:hypothetical protein